VNTSSINFWPCLIFANDPLFSYWQPEKIVILTTPIYLFAMFVCNEVWSKPTSAILDLKGIIYLFSKNLVPPDQVLSDPVGADSAGQVLYDLIVHDTMLR
jgi:hypothetical protein